MDSNNENKNNKNNNKEEVSSNKKTEQLDLKNLITKIDNRVKTKVNKSKIK